MANVRNRMVRLQIILNEARDFFPNIYAEGLQLCRKGGVKKYIFKPSNRTLWVVVGKSGEYIINEFVQGYKIKFFCSCPDFLFHILFKTTRATILRRRSYCYHIIARVAAELNELRKSIGKEFDPLCIPEIFEEDDEYFPQLIREIREGIKRYEVEEFEEERVEDS